MKDALRQGKLDNEPAGSRQEATTAARQAGGSAAWQSSGSSCQSFFEQAPVSSFILNSQGQIIEVNLAGVRLLGVERNALLMCAFIEFVTPEWREFFARKMEEANAQSGPQNYDLQVMQAGNGVFFVCMNVSRQAAEDGTPLFYAVATDITQHKLLKQSLCEQNQYINKLLAFASGPIVVWDISLRMTMVNPAVEKLTGFGADKLVGQPVEMLFPVDCTEFLLPTTQPAVHAQQFMPPEQVTMHHVSGAVRSVSWTSAPIYADDEKTVLAVIAQGQDISERIRQEHDLRIASSVFESQLGVLIIDLDGRVVRVNQAFSRLTGYGCDEVVGRPLSTLCGSMQNNQDFFSTLWEQVNREHYWQGELRDYRKNGEGFPVFMTMTAVSQEQGEVTHYVASLIDITMQKEAENLLRNRHLMLEKQAERTVAELKQLKEETAEVNTALKVMIKLRETENLEAKRNLLFELEQEIMPFLTKLKKSSNDSMQMRLLSTLDANLQRLVASYGSTMGLSSLYRNLTPKEIQVACMVREGSPTKVIAATLSISPETVSIHRKNIRRKLGLETKSENLRSYLVTLADASPFSEIPEPGNTD